MTNVKQSQSGGQQGGRSWGKGMQRGLWAALMKEMPLKGNTMQPQGEEHRLGSQLCTKFSFT